MTGRTLAHYQILEKLGAGGMGEVYKARDTRLSRLVAIKVLAPGKVADAARKRRFIQEAQAASALNHPNIVVIHDINAQDGVDYMVMEYIAGKTLDAVIPRQGMRLGEALKTAIPIADGLSAAHGAGIVHRDIKPTNIMVADDGRVKVLDFGLAKLTEEAPAAENEPTVTERPRTEEGAVVGTIAYMSPEQAEGKKLDARSDVFSFGSVLYEMVTGRRAFSGESRVSTLSAVLKEEPPAPTGIPQELDRILRRAMRKDPAKRFQHMDDLRVALEELKEESDSGRLSTSVTAATAPATASRAPLWAALGLLAAGGTGYVVWNRASQPTPAPPPLQLRQLTADSGLTTNPDLSPDGKLLAYASDRATQANLDIWVQPMTEGARPIRLTTDGADEAFPSFSPDGGMIAFWSQRDGGGIYVAPALGGEERLVVRGGYEPRFSPDGRWIAYTTGAGNFLHDSKLFVIPAAGGAPRQVGADVPWTGQPTWSPDGQWIAVSGMDGSNRTDTRELWMVPVQGGGKAVRTTLRKHLQERKVLGANSFFRTHWSGSSLLFATASEAWALDMEPGSWRPSTFRKLAAATGNLYSPRGSPERLVFTIASNSYRLWSLSLDHATGRVKGAARALPHSGGDQSIPSLSADGRLVYLQASPGGREIRVRDGLEGKDRSLLSGQLRPRISPDGSRVAYSSIQDGSIGGLSIIDAGGGQATELIAASEKVNLFDWTPTGTGILFWHGTPTRFSRVDPRTRQRQELLSHPSLNIHTVELSPDEQWAAFMLPDRGRALMVAPVRDGKAAPEGEWIEIAGKPSQHSRPWWSPDGNLLYYISDRDHYGCFWAQRLHPATRRPVGEPIAVYHLHETRRSVMMGAAPFGPAVGKGVLVFSMREESGNVWIAEPPRPAVQ